MISSSPLVISQGWGLIDLRLPRPRVARARKIIRLHPFFYSKRLLKGMARLLFTARIERAPFHRARSASKKGTCRSLLQSSGEPVSS
jgi:hypothetical protein